MNRVTIYALAVLAATGVFVTTATATDWLRQVTTDPGDDELPSWSPDCTTIAFHSERSGNYDIWTVPAGGGSQERRTARSTRWSMSCTG